MAVAENGWQIILVPTLLFACLWFYNTSEHPINFSWNGKYLSKQVLVLNWKLASYVCIIYSVLVQDKYGTMILFTSHKRQFSRGKRYLHIFTKIESIIFHTAPYVSNTINNCYTSLSAIALHASLLPSLSDSWMVCICCDTADNILSSKRLNSSKQPQAPTWQRPTKIRPMAWEKG